MKEVTVWKQDAVIKALRFQAAACEGNRAQTLLNLADRIKRGEILIIHNPKYDPKLDSYKNKA